MLLLAIVNNKAVDYSVQRELDVLPFRCHYGECASRNSNRIPDDGHDENAHPTNTLDNATSDSSVLPATTLLSSSYDSFDSKDILEEAEQDVNIDKLDMKDLQPKKADDEVSSTTNVDNDSSCRTDAYPFWLVELTLKALARHKSSRLLSTQLCARLLVEMMVDACMPTSHCFTQQHKA